MNAQQIAYYKERFRTLYPAQAKELEAAKSDEERYVVYDRLVVEARNTLQRALSDLDLELRETNLEALMSSLNAKHDRTGIKKAFISLQSSLADSDTSETAVVALNPDLLNVLTNASGEEIKTQVQKLLDGVERLSNMTDNDAIEVSLEIIGFSAVAVGIVAGAVTLYQLLTLSGAFTVSATLAGVVAATVAVVVAVAAFIVLSVLIPILYFMNKPAMCVVFLINELNGGPDLKGNQLEFVDDYSVHGKPTILTNPIPGAYPSPLGTYAYGGFFFASKRDNALIGAQYGFKLACQYNPDGKKADTKEVTFAFGVACPLSIGSNNCYCGFDISAKEAAQLTSDKDKQNYNATNDDGINISITCNSKSGSVAYYIARIYQ